MSHAGQRGLLVVHPLQTAGGEIDLAPLRAGLSTNWEEYGPSLHRIASRVIRQELPETVACVRLDDTYRVIFANVSELHAINKCQNIADEIERRLTNALATDGTPGRNPKRRQPGSAANLGSSRGILRVLRAFLRALGFLSDTDTGITRGHGGPRGESVNAGADTLKDVRSPSGGGRGVGHPVAARVSATNIPVRAHDGLDPKELVISPRDGLGGDAVAKHSVGAEMPRGPAIADQSLRDFMEHPKGLPAHAAGRNQNPAHPKRTAIAFPPADLRFEFFPFWNLMTNLVTAYGIKPMGTAGPLYAAGPSGEPRHCSSAETFMLDRIMLRECVTILESSKQPQKRALVCTFVHARTLQDPTMARQFLQCCERIPEELRPKLVIEIADAGDVIRSEEGRETISNVSRFVRATLARLPVSVTNMSALVALPIAAAGCDFSGDCREEEAVIRDLEAFAVIARRSKLASYARGLQTVSLTIAAVAAGFRYIEGAPVGRSGLDHLLEVMPFKIADLYGARPSVRTAAL
jgi:hypothetical protein